MKKKIFIALLLVMTLCGTCAFAGSWNFLPKTTFTYIAADPDPAPETGDSTPLWQMGAVTVAAAAAIVIIGRKKRRQDANR